MPEIGRRRSVGRIAPVPLTPRRLFARLDALGIAHRTHAQPPVFTVAEAVALPGRLRIAPPW
jgi:hypothetical protein